MAAEDRASALQDPSDLQEAHSHLETGVWNNAPHSASNFAVATPVLATRILQIYLGKS